MSGEKERIIYTRDEEKTQKKQPVPREEHARRRKRRRDGIILLIELEFAVVIGLIFGREKRHELGDLGDRLGCSFGDLAVLKP